MSSTTVTTMTTMTSMSDMSIDYQNEKAGIIRPVVVHKSNDENVIPRASHEAHSSDEYLTGAKLHFVTAALMFAIFLVNFEITVVSTTLVAITNTLSHFSSASWIITAYLLTYTAFVIVWAKLSDIYGRKPALLTALSLFIVASAACSGVQTINELLVFRAFQGLGGSGVYALVMIVQMEIAPKEKFAGYTALISAVFALSLLVGPLVGGGIVDKSISNVAAAQAGHFQTWRWVFLLNVPAGLLTLASLWWLLHPKFLNRNSPDFWDRKRQSRSPGALFVETLFRVDWIGCFLMLAFAMILVAAFELAGRQYSWSSPIVIAFLCMSGALGLLCLAWSYYITRRYGRTEPVLPWRFLQNRGWMGILLSSFLVGAPFTSSIVLLPLRFQTVSGLSPLESGIRLLPFCFACPVGSVVSSMLCSKTRILPVILLFGGTTLATIGFALIATLPASLDVNPAQYGYQVLSGFGTGCNIGILTLLSPVVVNAVDRAIAIGASVQFRMLGGAIGLGMLSGIQNSIVTANLTASGTLTADQLESISNSASAVGHLPSGLQESVRLSYASAYSVVFKIILGLCAAQFLTICMMLQKKAIRPFQRRATARHSQASQKGPRC